METPQNIEHKSETKFVNSLVAAIDGNLNGMAHNDLVLTCKMLENGRALWRKEAEELRATLVMLKRELDPHISDPLKYEFPKTAWDEVCNRHGDFTQQP